MTAYERHSPAVARSQALTRLTAANSCWRPFGLVRATFFSSGDRIRTCDLWVMSQPVAVSNRPSGLKGAGHAESPVAAITPRITESQQLRRVSFPNPFPTLHIASAAASASHGRDARPSSPGDKRVTGPITPLEVSDDSAATTVNGAAMVLHCASLLECRRWARHDAVHGQHERRGTSASLWIEPVAPNPLLRSRTAPSRPRRPTDRSVRSTTPADRGRRCAEGYGRISQ